MFDSGVCERLGETTLYTNFRYLRKRLDLPPTMRVHDLRHTAATWLMQAGVDKWEAAGFLGMTVEMLDRVYGHRHPQLFSRLLR